MIFKNRNLIILFFLFLLTGTIGFSFKRDIKLEVYALKYGDSLYHSRNIYYEDPFNEPIPFAWMFYVIKYKDKIILIDTGFEEEKYIKSFNIDYRNPLDILKRLNIEPEKVTDVIITHSHFDHIGNVDKFTKAKIYIQEEELEHFKKNLKNQEILSFFKSNKIISFKNDYKLYNFFEIKKIGGHTIGSLVVSFDYNNKKYIITGDECYLIDNCKGNPIGIFYNIKKNKDFIEWINSVENKVILPLHDNKIFDEYPVVGDFIAKII